MVLRFGIPLPLMVAWQTFKMKQPAAPGEQIAAAIAIRFTIRPGRTRKIPFILAWDFPVTEFAPGINYYRRYTDFFGRTGNNAWSVARTAFKHNELVEGEDSGLAGADLKPRGLAKLVQDGAL
jgi:uncharacterized protein (DUF608 family)